MQNKTDFTQNKEGYISFQNEVITDLSSLIDLNYHKIKDFDACLFMEVYDIKTPYNLGIELIKLRNDDYTIICQKFRLYYVLEKYGIMEGLTI